MVLDPTCSLLEEKVFRRGSRVRLVADEIVTQAIRNSPSQYGLKAKGLFKGVETSTKWMRVASSKNASKPSASRPSEKCGNRIRPCVILVIAAFTSCRACMNDSEILRRDLKPALVFLSGELIAVPIPLDREEVILGRASRRTSASPTRCIGQQHGSRPSSNRASRWTTCCTISIAHAFYNGAVPPRKSKMATRSRSATRFCVWTCG